MYTVRLEDDTCGTCGECAVGDLVTVTLADENGLPIERHGRVAEILEA